MTNKAFTLIELSIVLIIIGVIVGGVLVGRDLISAAGIRAQITQIEKYNQAANTFKGKYGSLPGDIPNPDATKFGFISRGSYGGTGDGNGTLEGTGFSGGSNAGYQQSAGETPVFWVDLSTAQLIDGNFTTASETAVPGFISGSGLNAYFPQGKIGQGNYVNVMSTYTKNYFSVSAISSLNQLITSNYGLTVSQANAIDKKMDDGLPGNGNVLAMALNYTGGYNSPVFSGVATYMLIRFTRLL